MNTSVFNIQRFSTSDGPGIRTVVFLKGCPLDCAWCHNPESKSAAPEIFYKSDSCIECRACEAVCQNACHSFGDGHTYDRADCIRCGKCAGVCPSEALQLCGEHKTVGEIIHEVLKDKPFYDESGGGMTLSGGEPLLHFETTLSLLKEAKSHGLHTAIETSGFTKRDISELHPFTDLWLFDIKLTDEAEHIRYTGVSNVQILENLRRLNALGAKLVLRCPIIPDINMYDEHFDRIASLSRELCNVTAINLEPYHPLGVSKAVQLDRVQSYDNNGFLERADLEPIAERMRTLTDTEVIIL